MSTPLTTFLLVAVVFAALSGGHLKESPDARFYLECAARVRSGDFGEFFTASQANFSVMLFALLLAFVQMIAGGQWQWGVLIVNVVCAAAAGAVLVNIVRTVTPSIAAAAAALLFYMGCYDIFSWTRYLLTDMIYLFISTVVFLLVIRGVVDDSGRPRWPRRIALAAATMAAVLSRPVGIVLVPVVVMTEVFLVPPARIGRRTLWTIIGSGAVAVLLIHAVLFQDMRRWPFHFMRPKLVEYALREAGGEVVWQHAETSHRPPATEMEHLGIAVDRLVRFFQVTSVPYSRTHNAANLIVYLPLYVLAAIGIVDRVRSSDRRRSAAVDASLLFILATALLCAATILDYDWRYRTPLIPQMIVLAACGVDALVRRKRSAAG